MTKSNIMHHIIKCAKQKFYCRNKLISGINFNLKFYELYYFV